MIAAHHQVVTRGLPYDEEVDYVESTGTQYIDTGILQAGDLEIGSVLMPSRSSYDSSMGWGYFVYFGCGQDDQAAKNIVCRVHYQTFSTMLFWFANPGNGISPISATINTSSWNTVSVDVSKAIVNGTTYTYNDTPVVSGLKDDLSIYIFAGNKPDENPWRPMYCRMKSFWIKKNGSLIMDLIPVRVGDAGFMFDTVSKQLMETLGTGNLIAVKDS